MDKDTFDMFKKMQEGFGLIHDRIIVIESSISLLEDKLNNSQKKINHKDLEQICVNCGNDDGTQSVCMDCLEFIECDYKK